MRLLFGIFVLLIFHVLRTEQQLRIVFRYCTYSYNQKYFTNVTSYCRRINRTSTLISVDMYIPKGIQYDAPMNFKVIAYKKFGTQYKPSMIKVRDEFCAAIFRRSNPIFEWLPILFRGDNSHTNFLEPCPIKGHRYLKYVAATVNELPPILPVGFWRIDNSLHKPIINGTKELMVSFSDFYEITATGAEEF